MAANVAQLSADSINVVHPLFQEEGDGSHPISALQLQIVQIASVRAAMLNQVWHSRMPYLGLSEMCKPCFGATFANRYYAVAMWSLPIAANRLADGFNSLELRRMAISKDAPKNTASRMLKVMRLIIKRDMPHVKKVISYQDTGAHLGTIYKADNWTPQDCGEYISWNNHSQRPGSVEQSTSAQKFGGNEHYKQISQKFPLLTT